MGESQADKTIAVAMKKLAFVLFFPVFAQCSALAAPQENQPQGLSGIEATSTSQGTIRKKVKPSQPARPAPSRPAAPEKRHSWIYRLFHRKPRPQIAATPAPAPARKRKPKPAPEAIQPVPLETSSTVSTRKPPKKQPAPAPEDNSSAMSEPAPFVPPERAPEPRQIGGASSNGHYQEIKTKALEDKSVQELQSKADNAPEGEEQRKASRDYYKTLFNKMRKLDPGLKDRIDRTEAATLRRIGSE